MEPFQTAGESHVQSCGLVHSVQAVVSTSISCFEDTSTEVVEVQAVFWYG